MTSRWSSCTVALVLGAVAASSCSRFDATVASLSADGDHVVSSYEDFPDVPEFADATIYYPVEAIDRVGGVAIAPGYTEAQDNIEWWGTRLASHGFAVLLLDTNDPRDRTGARAEALLAAVEVLRREGTRAASPLFGRIDPGRMAIMGHSMGGGGALIAANEQPDEVQAVIPFTPWEPEGVFDAIRAPTLVIAGSADGIAEVADHAWRHFQTIPESTPKLYVEVDDGGHFIADTKRGHDLATIGRYGVAWLKRYLDGDERYDRFLYGEVDVMDEGKFSRFVMSP